MLRYRGPRPTLAQVKELDAFPKIPDTYSETSARGGAISVCTFLLIFVLVVSEIRFYLDSRLKFKYEVDVNFTEKVWLNFDVTVATECRFVGADVVDATGQAWMFQEEIKEEKVPFQQSPKEAALRDALVKTKELLMKNNDGTRMSELAIKKGFNATAMYFRKESYSSTAPADSCRFYGNVLINKVSGNFHVTAGKSVPLRGGHAHLSFISNDMKFNYSHRINHFSFGDMRMGLINVLDGDEHLTEFENSIFQYYINAVSTRINSRRYSTHTYQFSVSEQARLLDHTSGSHGMAGVFFKYNFSPLAVTIDEKTMPFGRLLVRLSGIIGGVFATSMVLDLLIGIAFNTFKGKFAPTAPKESKELPETVSLLSAANLNPEYTNS